MNENGNCKESLSSKLVEVFGKDTFTEEELNEDFYVELKIRCSEFFKTEDGCFNMDLFWSEGLKKWLLSDK